MNRRRVLQQANINKDMVIMTSATNPKILSLLYNAGLCASPNVMYKSEAEAVPDGTFGHCDLEETRPCSPFDFATFNDPRRPTGEDFSAFRYFTNITEIGQYAFYNAHLAHIEFPETDFGFGYRCLNANDITFLSVPKTYTGTKGKFQCFDFGSASNKKSIYFPHTTPPGLQRNAWVFIGSISTVAAIYVPDGCVDAYKEAWSNCNTVSSGTSDVNDWLALIKPISEYTNS